MVMKEEKERVVKFEEGSNSENESRVTYYTNLEELD
jgi:hypothetical protein